jgi:hypothetical protein
MVDKSHSISGVCVCLCLKMGHEPQNCKFTRGMVINHQILRSLIFIQTNISSLIHLATEKTLFTRVKSRSTLKSQVAQISLVFSEKQTDPNVMLSRLS